MTVIKYGDTDPTTWTAVGMDLTGCTVRLMARDRAARATPIELPAAIIDQPGGVVEWTPDGLLPVGSYEVELEVTRASDGLIVTFPNDGFGRLTVSPDIR